MIGTASKMASRQMTFLIITATKYPNGMGTTNRMHYSAKGLQKLGPKVEILIYRPTENPNQAPQNTEVKGIFDGVTYQYQANSTIYARSALIRQLQFARGFYSCLLRLMRCQKGDCVLFFPINLPMLILVKVITMIKGLSLFCERDEHPFLNKKMNGLSGWWERMFIRISSRLYDGIIVISYPLEKYFSEVTGGKVPILVNPIAFDSDEFIIKPTAVQDIVFASGNLSEEKDGIQTIIQAFAKVAQEFPSYQLVISGDNSYKEVKEGLNLLIQNLHLSDRVTLAGYISRSEYLHYLASARVHILAKPPSFQSIYCMPSKIAEFLASGRPVIVSDVGQIDRYLNDRESAFLVTHYSPESYAEKLREVLQQPELAEMVGEKGREVALQVFDYQIFGQRLFEFINFIRAKK
jgi:glycosyltransferase involved in cell wall biosynthesis